MSEEQKNKNPENHSEESKPVETPKPQSIPETRKYSGTLNKADESDWSRGIQGYKPITDSTDSTPPSDSGAPSSKESEE